MHMGKNAAFWRNECFSCSFCETVLLLFTEPVIDFLLCYICCSYLRYHKSASSCGDWVSGGGHRMRSTSCLAEKEAPPVSWPMWWWRYTTRNKRQPLATSGHILHPKSKKGNSSMMKCLLSFNLHKHTDVSSCRCSYVMLAIRLFLGFIYLFFVMVIFGLFDNDFNLS